MRAKSVKISGWAVLAGTFLAALPAFALSLEESTGLSATGGAGGANIARQTDIPGLVGGTILSLSTLIGTLFLGLILYGGAIWMTSQGSDEKIKKAKNIITSAVIGLIVTVSAWSISTYVLDLATTATGG